MTLGRAWTGHLAVAGFFAAIALIQWIGALASGRPVLYGEGAVANAALLLRDGNPYLDDTGAVAANYPPLYLWLTSLADPFRAGRLVTIASAVAIAVLIWWRARGAGSVKRTALALTWLALTPVAIWGAAVKPDMFAIALTVTAVAAVDHAIRPAFARRDPSAPWLVLAGALLAAAVWAKPTALLPAAAVLTYLLFYARPAFMFAAAGAVAVGGLALAHAYTLGFTDVWRHVVVWNALPWSAEQAAQPVVIGAATFGILVAAAARVAAFSGPALAYASGAAGVVLLGGREGATINYLLDLIAATMYALATVGPRLASSARLPLAAAAQIVLGFAVLAPFGLIPGREGGTGAWGSAARSAVIESLPSGDHLVEDSGLLIAAGMRPVVDDLFLWSRLVTNGSVDPAPLLDRIRRGEVDIVVSEVDLERIDEASAAARTRWHPLLVDAVLERYERYLDQVAGARLWTYRPR